MIQGTGLVPERLNVSNFTTHPLAQRRPVLLEPAFDGGGGGGRINLSSRCPNCKTHGTSQQNKLSDEFHSFIKFDWALLWKNQHPVEFLRTRGAVVKFHDIAGALNDGAGGLEIGRHPGHPPREPEEARQQQESFTGFICFCRLDRSTPFIGQMRQLAAINNTVKPFPNSQTD